MKRSLYNKFTNALKSGEFKQVQGTLREMDRDKVVGHCGQGVLCELMDRDAVLNGEASRWDGRHYKFHLKDIYGDGQPGMVSQSTIPPETLKCLGAGALQFIPGMNDSGGTFSQILEKMEALVNSGKLTIEEDE